MQEMIHPNLSEAMIKLCGLEQALITEPDWKDYTNDSHLDACPEGCILPAYGGGKLFTMGEAVKDDESLLVDFHTEEEPQTGADGNDVFDDCGGKTPAVFIEDDAAHTGELDGVTPNARLVTFRQLWTAQHRLA